MDQLQFALHVVVNITWIIINVFRTVLKENIQKITFVKLVLRHVQNAFHPLFVLNVLKIIIFMMENVMRQLKQWQEKGYALPKTSVNISRRTLFHPTTLASVLAIQSR